MARKRRAAIRDIIRQVIKDEFQVGVDLEWTNDELNIHIDQVLREISERKPVQTKATLTTTAGSKELDISSLEYLWINQVEFRVDKDPQQFRNFDLRGDTLIIDTSLTPSASENVYIYYAALHTLTNTSSTLTLDLERLLVLGVTAYAGLSRSRGLIDKINIAGKNVSKLLENWASLRLALFKEELNRAAIQPPPAVDNPRG